ncbi:uncharacterized protein LOC129723172 [Wyeomyia smithii]|uniref:uncharacterized protein LOC129723172 n=1 Tax=Wyeomyia smithii TaxID=174621 RepID=UPI002467BE74|nr:uncharacterized protein LOC129723172 [Wyeomyia smithii]
MFKITIFPVVLVLAFACVSARPNPKPDEYIITHSAPVVLADPDVVIASDYVAASPLDTVVYERTFHGDVAPLIAAYSTPYLTAPVVFDTAYDPPVVALAPSGTVLLK